MFKIKVENVSSYSKTSEPFQIRYEQSPDISRGISNIKYHQSFYSSHKKADKVGSDLSLYLSESYLFLDLVYSKLKQLESLSYALPSQVNFCFNALENSRLKLIKSSQFSDFAYKHIDNFIAFMCSLKNYCFIISKDYSKLVNPIWNLLIAFNDSFILKYRSAFGNSKIGTLTIFE